MIEARGARGIGLALRRQLRAAVPAGMTAEDAAGAEQRLGTASQGLRDAVYAMMRDAALLGVATAEQGAAGGRTPKKELVGVGIDWALVNADVLRWLETYEFELVRNIDENSRRALREAVDRWVRNGLPLPDLITELEPIFGARRAELIASTEVTRAFAEANLRAWRASGVVERVSWRTANDERVCPI